MVTIILHTLGLWILINVLHYSLEGWQLLLILISGGSGKEYTAAMASVTAHHLFLISGYLLIIYAAAYLCGKALRFLINRFQLDKFSVFEITAPGIISLKVMTGKTVNPALCALRLPWKWAENVFYTSAF